MYAYGWLKKRENKYNDGITRRLSSLGKVRRMSPSDGDFFLEEKHECSEHKIEKLKIEFESRPVPWFQMQALWLACKRTTDSPRSIGIRMGLLKKEVKNHWIALQLMVVSVQVAGRRRTRDRTMELS